MTKDLDLTRRGLLAASAAATAGPALAGGVAAATVPAPNRLGRTLGLADLAAIARADDAERLRPYPVDLAPARWIWAPTGRTLPNTFILFRKSFDLAAAPREALAWIAADSRYALFVNGARVAWGSAPYDPRTQDVDPLDLAPYLRVGENSIAVEVLFYGHAEGSWAGGRPGLLFAAWVDGAPALASGEDWSCAIDRAHRPGQHKRFFLRALQEEADLRRREPAWTTERNASRWRPARLLPCRSDKPSGCTEEFHWSADTVDFIDPAHASLRLRQIPPLTEAGVRARDIVHSGTVRWRTDPEDWFALRLADSFEIDPSPIVRAGPAEPHELPPASGDVGRTATYAFDEVIVGFPRIRIDAPEGAIVEIMVSEAHDPDQTRWLDTGFFAWSRFICREGEQALAPFDYEAFRFVQLHVRNARRPVRVLEVAALRRTYPFPETARVVTSDPDFALVLDAARNTMLNQAQDVAMDCVARERQQYSGDIGHCHHVLRAFGATPLSRRYLFTFSQGQISSGQFLDTWPGGDRMTRIAQREIHAAAWGPLVDHGVGFVFDVWNHWMETGDRADLAEVIPRLPAFVQFLLSLKGADGLLKVEDIGIAAVWMDTEAFTPTGRPPRQADKRCSFNLYAAAMLRDAYAPLMRSIGDEVAARFAEREAGALIERVLRRHWDASRSVFVDNLPTLAEDGAPLISDRTLAMAVLHRLNPGGRDGPSIRTLSERPGAVGLSFPANAYWRLWALGRAGAVDPMLKEFRTVWRDVVRRGGGNSLPESFGGTKDSTSVWSHAALAPLASAIMNFAGIRPAEPGYARTVVRPLLGDLPDLRLAVHTPHGPIAFAATREGDAHAVRIDAPGTMRIDLEAAPGCVLVHDGAALTPGPAKALPGGPISFTTRRI